MFLDDRNGINRLFEMSLTQHHFDITDEILKTVEFLTLPKGYLWWLRHADSDQLKYLTEISVFMKLLKEIDCCEDSEHNQVYDLEVLIVNELHTLGFVKQAIDLISRDNTIMSSIDIDVLESYLTYDKVQKDILYEAANEILDDGWCVHLQDCVCRIVEHPRVRDSVIKVLKEYKFDEAETTEFFSIISRTMMM